MTDTTLDRLRDNWALATRTAAAYGRGVFTAAKPLSDLTPHIRSLVSTAGKMHEQSELTPHIRSLMSMAGKMHERSGLTPHIRSLVSMVGEIHEQRPDLLPKLALSVGGLFIPQSWVLYSAVLPLGFASKGLVGVIPGYLGPSTFTPKIDIRVTLKL